MQGLDKKIYKDTINISIQVLILRINVSLLLKFSIRKKSSMDRTSTKIAYGETGYYTKIIMDYLEGNEQLQVFL